MVLLVAIRTQVLADRSNPHKFYMERDKTMGKIASNLL